MQMSDLLNQKPAMLLGSIFYWAFALLLLQSFAQNRSEFLTSEQEQEIRREIALVRSNLEAKIFENIYKADSLASIVTVDPLLGLERWDEFAGKLVRSSPYVRNVGAAPDNIIKHVYPLQGNEKALGFDFRTNPKQYASVLKAQKLGSVYLDGPVDLVQGGQAIIARFPIFSDFPQQNDYWGSVSIVLDYEKLLEDSGINQLTNVSISLQRQTSYSQKPFVFYGSPETLDQADIILPILLPNTEWQLAGHFELKAPDMSLIYALGFAGIALFYTSLIMLLRAYRISHNAALQDELTLLHNRRYMMSYLDRITTDSPKPEFALLNIDLNDFKKVNDAFGHNTGDRLLKHVAYYLKHAISERDTLARIGGDEFLVVLIDVDNAAKAARRIEFIKSHLSNHPLLFSPAGEDSSEEHSITPSLSIGFALFDPHHPVSIEELLNIADQHMYQRKQAEKTSAR